MDGTTLRDRVRSLVAGDPFWLVETPTPFDFDRVPAQLQDHAARVEWRQFAARGGFAFSEVREDDIDIWVAQVVTDGDPQATYGALQTLASSLTSAVIRDGAGVGDYAVGDNGRRVEIQQPTGAAYQVLRLTLPCDYVLTV